MRAMALDARDEVAALVRRFQAEGSRERAAAEKAYMKSALTFHGVGMAGVRGAAAALVKAHPSLTREEVRALADAAYASDFFDVRSVAIAVMEKRVKLLQREDLPWIVGLVRKSACWAHVDWLATQVVEPLLQRTSPGLPEVEAWAADEDFWVRRTALLSQLRALRSGGGDFALFARIAAPMLPEKEFFIRKAIGWVLREVSKKRPELVFQFLRAHPGKLSGLTFREASKHLPEEMKRELVRGKAAPASRAAR
jgi:3-methyladenine DNA glycosylase AlkD